MLSFLILILVIGVMFKMTGFMLGLGFKSLRTCYLTDRIYHRRRFVNRIYRHGSLRCPACIDWRDRIDCLLSVPVIRRIYNVHSI